MYLNSINIYRSIAILLIVSAHCDSISDLQIDTTSEAIFANLTAGSTIHFIFISGFLFHHVFYRKKKTNTFYFGKVKRLLIPYTILSIVPIFLKIKFEPEFWNTYFILEENGILYDYIIPSFLYYVTGAHLVSYWYIPFAMCLFIMYPLHIKFIEAKPKTQFMIIGLLYVIAVLIHRPLGRLNILQSIAYFTPPYLLGILCSINKSFIYNKLKGKEFLFLATAVALAVIQVLFGRYNNYSKPAFVYDGIDLILIQKSVLCIFFVIFLHRFEHSKNRFIVLLASTSFAIFFIHGYVLHALTLLKSEFEIQIVHTWLYYFSTWGILVTLSLLLAISLKKILPKYSKYIIGY